MFINFAYNENDNRAADVLKHLERANSIGTVHTSHTPQELYTLIQPRTGYDYDAIMIMPDRSGDLDKTSASSIFKKISNANNRYKALVAIIDDEQPPADRVTPNRFYSRANIETCISYLNSGADDAIRIPERLNWLYSRLINICARRVGAHDNIIRAGHMYVDLENKHVSINGLPLKTSRTEYAILEYMALRKNRACSKESLMDALGKDDLDDTKSIDVHICKIRKKIKNIAGTHNIQNDWSRSYCLTTLPLFNNAPTRQTAQQPPEKAQQVTAAGYAADSGPKLIEMRLPSFA